MSKSFTLDQLTEGIRDRHVGADNGRLISKWTRTGLLRGLNEHKRENMARLLENQAAQVLREASSLGAGAVTSAQLATSTVSPTSLSPSFVVFSAALWLTSWFPSSP